MQLNLVWGQISGNFPSNNLLPLQESVYGCCYNKVLICLPCNPKSQIGWNIDPFCPVLCCLELSLKCKGEPFFRIFWCFGQPQLQSNLLLQQTVFPDLKAKNTKLQTNRVYYACDVYCWYCFPLKIAHSCQSLWIYLCFGTFQPSSPPRSASFPERKNIQTLM